VSRISNVFAKARDADRAVLLLYVTAGHPTLDVSRIAALAAAEAADIVEIGIPFSDPVADGPVIQASTQAALRNGMKIGDCFRLANGVRERSSTAIVFLAYYNPVLRHGLEQFARDSAAAGVDGVICADLPAEEARPLRDALASESIDLIPMVAPTSTDQRLSAACKMGSGFIYCVSRSGVTGVRESLQEGLEPFLGRVRACTDLPRAVGFGISNAHHAAEVARLAEGVIIGSALVRLIDESPENELESRIAAFSTEIREGMNVRA
jgi:tryptophan synthase alpha chain